MANANTPENCPDCEGRLRAIETELVCEDCGLVAETDPIDHGPEWRSFDDDETNRKRTGAPLTRSRHDRGLSTEIGSSSRLRITGRKRRQIGRMRREHNRARFESKADRNQVTGFSEIWRIISQLPLPVNTREQACRLFASAQSASLLQGRSIEGFAAAAVYATCRTRSNARTIEEIVSVSYADAAELKAAYAALNRELGLPIGPIDPTEYLPRYASKLDLETDVERRATCYVTRLREANRIGSRNPSGIAAGCLYTATRTVPTVEPITQAAAADVASVAPATVRATVDNLRELAADPASGFELEGGLE
ncbi:transcription initiation factor IIB family protein [Natronoglomus mannanivorans]|uniref:Transcription initiation factor IIB family protein n=1 Tax=Natronoglomus mannanivorans TaxID=2979990 RepID=A0AAP2YX72_9EURY|nr:transcription initiation factor IIB family protein [Halobacteria archaeon AArc-xg1-1]